MYASSLAQSIECVGNMAWVLHSCNPSISLCVNLGLELDISPIWHIDRSELSNIFIFLDSHGVDLTRCHSGPQFYRRTYEIFQELHEKLLEFACNECHEDSDYAFIVFMGHGYGKFVPNMKMAGNTHVNIYEQCEACCTHPQSKLVEKPKTIIIQACRLCKYWEHYSKKYSKGRII